MTNEDPTLRMIVSTIFIGNVAFILLVFYVLFGYFKATEPSSNLVFAALFITMYITFFSAGAGIIKLYIPAVRRFYFKHQDSIDKLSLVIVIVVLAGVYYWLANNIAALLIYPLFKAFSIAGKKMKHGGKKRKSRRS